MTAVLGAVLGAAAAVGLWVAMRDVFRAPALRRLNLNGAVVPVGGGIVLVLAMALVAAGDAFASRVRDTYVDPVVPGALLLTVLGFGFLGLVDDLLEDGEVKGFRGHLSALAAGRLTTGAVKLVGGGLVALVVAPTRPTNQLAWMAADAALIALAANLANLFDRAPGRVGKLALVLGLAVVVTHLGSPASVGLAVLLGAAAVLAVPDLREQVMLGDAGANVVGGALGWTFAVQASGPARIVALVAVIALNVASERVSFSAVIDRTPGLRQLDRLGRLPTDEP